MTIQTTPIYGLPYPQGTDPADAPTQLAALCNRIEAVLSPIDTRVQVPVGVIMMWPTTTVPSADWILCNGLATILVSDYPLLAPILGTDGGSPAHLKIPDFTGRFPAGPGTPSGGGLGAGEALSNGVAPANGVGTWALTGKSAFKIPGDQAGIAAHKHSADGDATPLKGATHKHTYDRKHPAQAAGNFVGVNVTHGAGAFNNNFVATDQGAAAVGTASATQDAVTPDVSGNTSTIANTLAVNAHENRPPLIAINFIIKGR